MAGSSPARGSASTPGVEALLEAINHKLEKLLRIAESSSQPNPPMQPLPVCKSGMADLPSALRNALRLSEPARTPYGDVFERAS
jgi:hypothetical protein